MKITYSKVMNIDCEGEILGQFLEAFPKGEATANAANCAATAEKFNWHLLRDLIPQPARERYRLARNALVAEKKEKKETARLRRAAEAKAELPSRDGREGFEGAEFYGAPTKAEIEDAAIDAAYDLKFAKLFGEFAGRIA